jgi:hypothetical protein
MHKVVYNREIVKVDLLSQILLPRTSRHVRHLTKKACDQSTDEINTATRVSGVFQFHGNRMEQGKCSSKEQGLTRPSACSLWFMCTQPSASRDPPQNFATDRHTRRGSLGNPENVTIVELNLSLVINLGNAVYHLFRVLCLDVSFIITSLPFVLYGCETWSLKLREEHRLRVFENRVLRK